MIDQLITALSKEVKMSAAEIADTIWLALQMQEFQPESVSSDLNLRTEDERETNNQENQSNQGTLPKPKPEISELEEIPNQLPEEQKAGIYPRNGQGASKSSDLSFKVPDAPSLREPLTLARALKPLMRRVPSGRELVLDEPATIQRIADEGLWIPVLKPAVEPWLDLELVVDEAISMQIWRHTIRELEQLLKNYGIFRDVRVWGLITDENEQVQIRRGIGTAAKNQTLRSPKELIDPSGRRLVLVVSDCVSSLWRNGAVTPVLELWVKQGSMAIVQMLPKWLWKRTALGRASEVRLRALTPGACNQKLIAKEVSFWDELEEETGVKVPVFTLEQDKVATWAQMLSGKGSIWTLGYVFKLNVTPVDRESSLFNLTHSNLGAEQRVQAFRVTASPMARKLAGLLASAPVISLPIVRLIRETLLKDSQQVHVAEVFLGGLLKPLSEINADTNPDYVHYEFMDGVRELLVDSVPSQYVLNVVDEVSKYVAKKAGFSLETFAAALRNPQKIRNKKISDELRHFAMVTSQVLRCLGADYAKLADSFKGIKKQNKILDSNREAFDREFQLLLNSESSSAHSLLAFINRSLAQFNLSNYDSLTEVINEAYIRGVRLLSAGEKIEHPLAWIRVTAYDIIRKQSREFIKFSPIEESHVMRIDQEFNNNISTNDNESFKKLHIALGELNPDEREILILRNVKNLSWKEIQLYLLSKGKEVKNEAILRKRGNRALERLRSIYNSMESMII
ncbi:sigma-70 family RNA polymerase sigma factor [Anabaena subtropica]|uniref:Sigma-70 family RNA polymerase sigma factor n=1 Tax=Anabaena subtropica FACHB-260 TaxID=2692884 RepID=A0ABR8CK92_9NOST|nr:sigma-70 family RNA polymerase sigma factor [Anabaena subtropica]MBD2343636.1 sigma-70 family RNA polymerase sigma factor [Anabaena subtropica FACHB-260]